MICYVTECSGHGFCFGMVFLIETGPFKSTTTETSRSNISSTSGFSAGSGGDACPKGQILPVPNLRIVYTVAAVLLRSRAEHGRSQLIVSLRDYNKRGQLCCTLRF